VVGVARSDYSFSHQLNVNKSDKEDIFQEQETIMEDNENQAAHIGVDQRFSKKTPFLRSDGVRKDQLNRSG
jgi:hypothetical protein